MTSEEDPYELGFRIGRDFQRREDIEESIEEMRRELERIPENRRYNLGGKGVKIINKIHRLEMELRKEVD